MVARSTALHSSNHSHTNPLCMSSCCFMHWPVQGRTCTCCSVLSVARVRVQEPLAFTVVTVIEDPFCLMMSVDLLPYLISILRITHGKPSSCT